MNKFNILILRVSAIGDVIHTLPSIFLLKKVVHTAKISWVVQKKASALIKEQPFLDNVYVLPDKFLSLKNIGKTNKIVKQIKKNNWDLIIDFQGILKTTILNFFIPGEKIGFDKNNARLGLTTLFTHKQITPIYKNIIQKNLALVSGALKYLLKDKFKACPSIENIKNNFKLTIPNTDKKIVDDWLKINNLNKFIILSPNTTWPSKHWPQENWQKLIKLLSNKNINNHSIILLGKDFGEQAKNIAQYCNKNTIKIVTTPKWDLLKTSLLIEKSSILIAPDTGILHLADFLQKKTIAIFGPTLASRHGPFLLDKNIKNAIQIKCPHYYQKTHGNSKNSSNKDNCMYKLTPKELTIRITKIIKEQK